MEFFQTVGCGSQVLYKHFVAGLQRFLVIVVSIAPCHMFICLFALQLTNQYYIVLLLSLSWVVQLSWNIPANIAFLYNEDAMLSIKIKETSYRKQLQNQIHIQVVTFVKFQ
jgi:hypothetical protein